MLQAQTIWSLRSWNAFGRELNGGIVYRHFNDPQRIGEIVKRNQLVEHFSFSRLPSTAYGRKDQALVQTGSCSMVPSPLDAPRGEKHEGRRFWP